MVNIILPDYGNNEFQKSVRTYLRQPRRDRTLFCLYNSMPSKPTLNLSNDSSKLICRINKGVIIMKIAVGSDERTHLTDFVIEELKKRGIELELHGPLAGESIQWAEVAEKVAERVADGLCD